MLAEFSLEFDLVKHPLDIGDNYGTIDRQGRI